MKSKKCPNQKRVCSGVLGDLWVQFWWGLSTRHPARVCPMEPPAPGTPALGGVRTLPPPLPLGGMGRRARRKADIISKPGQKLSGALIRGEEQPEAVDQAQL